MSDRIELIEVPGRYAVWKLPADAPPPAPPAAAHLWSATRTAEELSLVTPFDQVPTGVSPEGPFRALRVAGTLDFALTGILAGLTEPLAEAGVPVFALSTYDTDYLLVPESHFERARLALAEAGYPYGLVH